MSSNKWAWGDEVSSALAAVGVTEKRVSDWLGRPCKCPERKRKMNELGAWARRILRGETDKAEQYLSEIMGERK